MERIPVGVSKRAAMSDRAKTILIGLVLAVAFIWPLGIGVARYLRAGRDVQCKRHLRELYDVAVDEQRVLLPGDRLFRDPLVVANDLGVCPECKRRYVYVPVPGKVDDLREANPPVAWCPIPCHDGHFNVLLARGTIVEMDAAVLGKMLREIGSEKRDLEKDMLDDEHGTGR